MIAYYIVGIAFFLLCFASLTQVPPARRLFFSLVTGGLWPVFSVFVVMAKLLDEFEDFTDRKGRWGM